MLTARQAGSKIGTSTLKYLLQSNPEIEVTIITREASTAEFPSSPQISVKKGSFDDVDFLQSAFAGAELAVLVVNVFAMDVEQPRLIDAAAKVCRVSKSLPNHCLHHLGRCQMDHSERVRICHGPQT